MRRIATRPKAPRVLHRLRPQALELEGRRLLATFTVMNTDAAGTGSLAEAVALADANNQANTITFEQSAFSTPETITLAGTALALSDAGGIQTITGPKAGLTVSGGGKSGVFQVDAGVTATLSGLTITHGTSSGPGGGLSNKGTVSLSDCTLTGNAASKGGGGLYNDGTATLTDCTLSGNSAVTGGGALLNWISAHLTLTDCTMSGNASGADGGGLYNSGTALLTDCTVSGNVSGLDGGGLTGAGPSKSTLTDTIIAGNTDPAGASDIVGFGAVSGSYDLIGTGGSGGLTNGKDHNIVLTSLSSLGLAPLGSYGGPTPTISLLPGSAAIGNGTAANDVTTDQRGSPLDSPDSDVGAYQSQGFKLTASAGSGTQEVTVGTAFADPLSVMVVANDPKEPVAGGAISFAAPSHGASAVLSTSMTTIGKNGMASVTAVANSTVGSYKVAASIPGAAQAVDFSLTNLAIPGELELRAFATWRKSRVVSLTLEAQIEPSDRVAILPTGTVLFELVRKNRKSKVLGEIPLKGGGASLVVPPAEVLNNEIAIYYGGDADYQNSTLTTMVRRGSLKAMERP